MIYDFRRAGFSLWIHVKYNTKAVITWDDYTILKKKSENRFEGWDVFVWTDMQKKNLRRFARYIFFYREAVWIWSDLLLKVNFVLEMKIRKLEDEEDSLNIKKITWRRLNTRFPDACIRFLLNRTYLILVQCTNKKGFVFSSPCGVLGSLIHQISNTY